MKKTILFTVILAVVVVAMLSFLQYDGFVSYALESSNGVNGKQGIGNVFKVNPTVKHTVEADGKTYQEVTVDVATAAVKFDNKDRIIDIQIDVTQTKMYLDEKGAVVQPEYVITMREEAELKKLNQRLEAGEINPCGVNWGLAGDVTDYDIVNNRTHKKQIEAVEQWAKGHEIGRMKFAVDELRKKEVETEDFSITAEDYWQAIYRAYQRAQ